MKSPSLLGISTKSPPARLADPRGYLLAEVMIAIAIFSIGFVAAETLMLSSAANNTTANVLTHATMLAADTLEDLKKQSVMEMVVGAYSDPDSPIDEQGNSGGIFHRSWVIDDPIGYDTARRIRVTVSWNRFGQARSIELATITRGDGT